MHSVRCTFFCAALIALTGVAAPVRAQTTGDNGAAPDSVLSSRGGVYTAAQAKAGGQTYAFMCQGCHNTGSHNNAAFQGTWRGKTLWQMFTYMRTEMPKTDPGSLSRREYTLILAYLLELNGMPAGESELTPDSALLKRIVFDVPPR